ncbi:MAG: hypothetical protein HRU19_25375 [Pseudobacteriovorax sp.]|nr:hypothetical protein [Pseudobacteriovorax sp.]
MLLRVITLLLTFSLSSCSTVVLQGFGNDSNKALSIVTADLFNQRDGSQDENTWKGDWLFRRARIELIDQQLVNIRPDILLFQNLMKREGSVSESDVKLLNAGVLNGFRWQTHKMKSFSDTGEQSLLASAIGLPARFDSSGLEGKSIQIGKGGFAAVFPVERNGQKILLSSVKLPNDESADQAYGQLIDFLSAAMKESGICSKRLIIGGYLPMNPSWQNDKRLLSTFSMKDTAEGFCNIAESCFTSTADNELQSQIDPLAFGQRTDRILVSNRTRVFDSQRVFDQSEESYLSARHGLQRFWPLHRFGWLTKVRLARCY